MSVVFLFDYVIVIFRSRINFYFFISFWIMKHCCTYFNGLPSMSVTLMYFKRNFKIISIIKIFRALNKNGIMPKEFTDKLQVGTNKCSKCVLTFFWGSVSLFMLDVIHDLTYHDLLIVFT